MDDLIAFVKARLDEDEAAARGTDDGTPWYATAGQFGPRLTTGPGENSHWDREVSDAVWVCDDEADGCPDANRAMMAEARHIARHDPARVLREVEAKRRLLRQFELRGNSVRAVVKPPTGGVWDDLLRMLALPWSDHGDYRQEWKP